MKVFIPTQLGVVKVDFDDYVKFNLANRVRAYHGTRKINITVYFEGKMHHLGRLLMGLKKGHKRIADHKDGDRFNMTRENLRITTVARNNMNKANYAKKSNLPRGVFKSGEKFTAMIWKNKKRYHLGTFPCPIEAHQAYLAKQKVLHGKYLSGRF